MVWAIQAASTDRSGSETSSSRRGNRQDSTAVMATPTAKPTRSNHRLASSIMFVSIS